MKVWNTNKLVNKNKNKNLMLKYTKKYDKLIIQTI